jgi:D-glycero-D-manno-heptose 1,7-bisphosphate phosphatase
MKKVVFLDRDGTINEEMGYINHSDRLRIFPEAIEAVRLLNQNNILAILSSNQSGLARGYFDEKVLFQTHKKMIEIFKKGNAHFDLTLYCPFLKEAVVERYKRDHPCRKPNTGMIDLARKIFPIDIKNSYIIGDRYKDILFGKKVGLKTILVLTGYGRGEYEFQSKNWATMPDIIAKNVLEGVKKIVE